MSEYENTPLDSFNKMISSFNTNIVFYNFEKRDMTEGGSSSTNFAKFLFSLGYSLDSRVLSLKQEFIEYLRKPTVGTIHMTMIFSRIYFLFETEEDEAYFILLFGNQVQRG